MYDGVTTHSPLTVYTDWIPRGGDNVIVQVETIQYVGGVDLKLQLYTRQSDEQGNGAALGTATTISTTGRHTVEQVDELEDLVRLKVEVPSELSTGPEWVHWRVIDWIWYDTPNAATT